MTTSNRKPPLAAALAVMPLVACAGPPGAASAACPSDPYAGTQAADNPAMQARHSLDGMLGVARSLPTTVQAAEGPAPPCPLRPRGATP